MDLKTRMEVLPCGKCEDMVDCDTCLFQKEAKEIYKQIRADAIDEFAHLLKETFNNEFPTNYHSTQPYFTLDNVRVLVDAVAKEQNNENRRI